MTSVGGQKHYRQVFECIISNSVDFAAVPADFPWSRVRPLPLNDGTSILQPAVAFETFLGGAASAGIK
jgi:hypothetical protein